MMSDTPMLMHAVRDLGPLTALELRDLWWPSMAVVTVQRHLRAVVREQVIAATMQTQVVGGRAQRRGLVYHALGTRPHLPEGTVALQTRRDLLDLLGALSGVPGLTGVRTTTLRPNGGGRVVVLRRDPARMDDHPIRLPWIIRPRIASEVERSVLLIADHSTVSMATHHAAACAMAQRCTPGHWDHAFPPPVPVIIAARRSRMQALHTAWCAGWSTRRPLMTVRADLDRWGWLAPVWYEGDHPPRQRVLLEGWTPDPRCPANDRRWDEQEHWPPPARARPTANRGPPIPSDRGRIDGVM